MTRLDQLEYNWQNQDEIKWKSKGKKRCAFNTATITITQVV